MFLIDKYKLKNFNNIFFHTDIYEQNIITYNLLKNKSNKEFEKLKKKNIRYDDMPNLFVHGVSGVGKHSLINILLYDIYNKYIFENTFKQTYHIKGYGNSITDIEIEQSQYHIVIEPTNTGFDKYLIQEVVKEYAKKKLINIYNNYPFKIIIINNIDNLNYYAQTSLRCTMEKYYSVCRFILIGKQISKLITPIRSRCLNIRIPTPSIKESITFLNHINILERRNLSKNKINIIANESNGNIKKMLWYFDMTLLKVNNYNFFWQDAIIEIVNIIDLITKRNTLLSKNSTMNYIASYRDILYKIFITNISGIDIIKELIKNLIIKFNNYEDLILKIIANSSIYEGRINKGKRTIIHLECFLNYIIQEIWHYINNKKMPLNITFDNLVLV